MISTWAVSAYGGGHATLATTSETVDRRPNVVLSGNDGSGCDLFEGLNVEGQLCQLLVLRDLKGQPPETPVTGIPNGRWSREADYASRPALHSSPVDSVAVFGYQRRVGEAFITYRITASTSLVAVLADQKRVTAEVRDHAFVLTTDRRSPLIELDLSAGGDHVTCAVRQDESDVASVNCT